MIGGPLSASETASSEHQALKRSAQKIEQTLGDLVNAINDCDGNYQYLDDLAKVLQEQYTALVALPIGPDPEGKIKALEVAMMPEVSSIPTSLEFGDLVRALKASHELNVDVESLIAAL